MHAYIYTYMFFIIIIIIWGSYATGILQKVKSLWFIGIK